MSTSYKPIEAIKEWLQSATPQMRELLAMASNCSDSMFRQYASGRRAMSAERAGALAAASATVAKTIPGAPAPLKRGDLCEACKKCEFYKNEG